MSTTTLDAPTAPTMDEVTTDLDSISMVELFEDNDPDHTSHIVRVPRDKEDTYTPQAWINEARIMSFPVKALCGHEWIPSRDPKNLPLCSRCKAIYEHDPYGHGDRDKLPDA